MTSLGVARSKSTGDRNQEKAQKLLCGRKNVHGGYSITPDNTVILSKKAEFTQTASICQLMDQSEPILIAKTINIFTSSF